MSRPRKNGVTEWSIGLLRTVRIAPAQRIEDAEGAKEPSVSSDVLPECEARSTTHQSPAPPLTNHFSLLTSQVQSLPFAPAPDSPELTP